MVVCRGLLLRMVAAASRLTVARRAWPDVGSAQSGASQLGKMFNTCSDLGQASDIDVTNFYSNVIGASLHLVA